MENKKLFILDGYGQIYRSYYAFMTNPLTDRNGQNVSAVFGFFNTVITILKHYEPDCFAVAMDSSGKTFRHDFYPQYKANRAKTPEDLHAQIPMIVSIMDRIGMKHFEMEGMEADDIIASLSRKASEQGLETVIITADKDLMQLVGGKVSALRPPRKGEHDYRLCHESEVLEIFGVRPDQIVDYLTILGDASDNVPGIAGIGEKGACKLLSENNSLDQIYSDLSVFKGSMRTKLENARDSYLGSRFLITLKDDIFDDRKIDFSEMEISGLDWDEATRAFSETGSSKLSSLARSMAGRRAPKTGSDSPLFKEQQQPELSEVPDVNADDPSRLIGFDLKSRLIELRKQGIDARPYFDIQIAAWLLDSESGRYSCEDLCQKYIGQVLDEKTAVNYLYPILSELLEHNGLEKIFYEMEMPLVSVLSDMESRGIRLDPSRLLSFSDDLKRQCSEIEDAVYTLCGHPFNLNSPKQLQEVLFVERDLPTIKKTSSGFSTDSEVLEELSVRTEDPVPSLILRYRTLNKLLSVYTDPLVQLCDSSSRIHTTFDQMGTATGRLSSREPNLQNIPVRTDEGRKIRDAFVPDEGFVLLSADYSQIELAVMAHISGDENLKDAFIRGEDVHRQTASLIFDIFPDMVSPSQRRIAKTINFGVIYGMSAFRLAGDLKIPRKDAQKFIDLYFERYPGVASFIESTRQQAAKSFSVSTLMGHRRPVLEIASSNAHIRQAAERVAVNTVIQGTAAEIVKLAMISIDNRLRERKLESRLLLQVHDEVILEVRKEELEDVRALVRDAMENAVKLSVPLRVSIEDASSWGQMH